MNHPVVSFTYLYPSQIGRLEEMLRGGRITERTKRIMELSERYVLMCKTDSQLHHDCVIHEIFLKDIKHPKISSSFYGELYDKMMEIYPPWLVSKLVPENESKVREKILKVLELAFDEVYQTDTINIEFLRCDRENDYSTIPDLLYRISQEEFNLIDQRLMESPITLTIQKRRNES